jgi:hypothetical protein
MTINQSKVIRGESYIVVNYKANSHVKSVSVRGRRGAVSFHRESKTRTLAALIELPSPSTSRSSSIHGQPPAHGSTRHPISTPDTLHRLHDRRGHSFAG